MCFNLAAFWRSSCERVNPLEIPCNIAWRHRSMSLLFAAMTLWQSPLATKSRIVGVADVLTNGRCLAQWTFLGPNTPLCAESSWHRTTNSNMFICQLGTGRTSSHSLKTNIKPQLWICKLHGVEGCKQNTKASIHRYYDHYIQYISTGTHIKVM